MTKISTVFCPTCGGEFDRCEWESDSRCPECEAPKILASVTGTGTAKTAQPVEGEACQNGPQGDAQ